MIHIVSDWQDEHVHVMFGGIDIIFPWNDQANKLARLLIFLLGCEKKIVITTGDSYTKATSKQSTVKCSWETFAKETEYYVTARYYVDTLVAAEDVFTSLSYNPVIKRDSTILNCNDCVIALNFSAADTVMLRPLSSPGWEHQIRNVDTVSGVDAHIFFGTVEGTEAACFYIPKYTVTAAKLCELPYSTMLQQLGRKLCF